MKFFKISHFRVAFFVGIAGIVFASQGFILKQLDAWQLLPRAERFSELYFADDINLPAAVKVGRAQELSFTIRNIEHQTIDYRYSILGVSADDGSQHVLETGNLRLGHGAKETLTESVKIPAIGSRMAVKVNLEYDELLPYHNGPQRASQSIHYWAKVVGLPAAVKEAT